MNMGNNDFKKTDNDFNRKDYSRMHFSTTLERINPIYALENFKGECIEESHVPSGRDYVEHVLTITQFDNLESYLSSSPNNGRLKKNTISIDDDESWFKYDVGDAGVLQMYLDLYGNYTRYNKQLNEWMIFNGRIWRVGCDSEVKNAILKMLVQYKDKFMTSNSGQLTYNFERNQSKSSSTKRISDIMQLIKDTVSIDNLKVNNQPRLLATDNGYVNLRTGELFSFNTKFDKETYITQMVHLTYDRYAKAPTFLSFLDKIFDGDQELINYVQKLCGYFITGETNEQILAIAFGDGGNGKGSLFNIIQSIFYEFTKILPSDLIMKKKYKKKSEMKVLSTFQNYRLVIVNKVAKNEILDEELIKVITGEDFLDDGNTGSKSVDYSPSYKLLLNTNYLPIITGIDKGIWRRIKVIPFNVVISEEEKRNMPNILSQLKKEAVGILAWTIEGSKKYYSEGLGRCESVTEATQHYKEEYDPVGTFMDSCITECLGSIIGAKELYECFIRYCKINELKSISHSNFGSQLKSKGYIKERYTRGYFYKDIEIIDYCEDNNNIVVELV